MGTRTFCCGRCGETFEIESDSNVASELMVHGDACKQRGQGADGPRTSTVEGSFDKTRTRRVGPKERRKS